jgi:hypothetical protein
MNAISINSAIRAPLNRFSHVKKNCAISASRPMSATGAVSSTGADSGCSFWNLSCSELAGDLGVSKPEQIRCQIGPDCDLKWKRAYTWVVESSGLKLKTKTDGLIKMAESPGNDRTLVVTITKNSTSQLGIYEIDFIGKCLSIWSCTPSVAETRTSFANFILAAD